MCTCIHQNSSNAYFGRNMDLDYDLDFKAILLAEDFPIKFKKEKTLKKHYKIIGVGVLLDGYPLLCDGENEKGLAIAGLNFPTYAHYYKFRHSKKNYAPYEMVLLLLATCKNVKEVKTLLKEINIYNISFNKDTKLTPLHYMVSDKKESIVIECLEDGMKVYDNKLNVLTNNPPFPYQCIRLMDYLHLTNEPFKNNMMPNIDVIPYSLGLDAISLPGDYSSTSRFIKSVYVNRYLIDEKDNGLGLFVTLSQVLMPKGVVKTSKGYEFTRYSSCYDQSHPKLYYRTYLDPTIREISIADPNLEKEKIVTYPLSYTFTSVKMN